MTNEIKEMCHKCKKYPAEYNQTYCEFCLGISNKDDYITNLQEENKHLDKVNCQLRKKINNDVYKSRIDKAIEHIIICNSKVGLNYISDLATKEILQILQGKDN